MLPKMSVLFCGFFWTKGLKAKDIYKEIFPIDGGKCLSLKAVPPWWQTFR
jgi:hypothetical protein